MNIAEIINSNDTLKHLDFMTVYQTIVALIRDDRITFKVDGKVS